MLQRKAGKLRFVDIQDVYQVVGDTVTFCSRWFGSSDRHAAIDLATVGIDYFASAQFGKVQAQRCLSDTRWSCNDGNRPQSAKRV